MPTLFEPKNGDVLLVYNNAFPIGCRLIDKAAQQSYPNKAPYPSHVAIILADPAAMQSDLVIYEASPPEYHSQTIDSWIKDNERAARHRRIWRWITRRYQYCEILSNPTLTLDEIQRMYNMAERLLGTPYKLVWEYCDDSDADKREPPFEHLDCSSSASLVLTASGHITYDDWNEWVGTREPTDVREIAQLHGWSLTNQIIF